MRLIPVELWAVLTIYQEARGESYEGKIAVARVIRNRMARKWSGQGDVVDTVLWPFQFSGWNTGDPNRRASARLDDADPQAQDCQRAWRESETQEGGVADAVFYYAPSPTQTRPDWATDERFVVQIGAHRFYRG